MDLVTTIASAIQLIITNAPKIIAAAAAAKQFIDGLFGAGVIDRAQQASLHDHVDAVTVALLKGEVPPQWTVEPDPIA